MTDRDFAYRMSFRAAPQALLAVDGTGVIRLANAEAERLLRQEITIGLYVMDRGVFMMETMIGSMAEPPAATRRTAARNSLTSLMRSFSR